MKLQRILATGALALAVVASSAQADVVIRIAGSSAYRSAVNSAITSLLGDSKLGILIADGATSVDKSNVALFSGTATNTISTTYNGDAYTIPAGTRIIVCTSWTGSVAGVYSLANSGNTSRGFIPATAPVTAGVTGSAAASDTTSAVDIAMSDVFLDTANGVLGTSWTTDEIQEAGGGTYKGIGVCPFKWVVSGTNTGLTNVSTQNVHTIYKTGYISKNLLINGAAATSATAAKVYGFGRDSDSGTRLTAFADTDLGATFLPVQYGITNTSSSSRVLGSSGSYVTLTPSSVVNTISYSDGQGGYSSGGTLATAIGAIGTGSFTGIASGTDAAIAYLSVSDAASIVSGASITATELTYNGVPYTLGNVYNGAYTFWSYEHMFYRINDTPDNGSDTGIFAEALAYNLLHTTVPAKAGTDVTSGSATYVDVTKMIVKRNTDGGYLIKK